MKNKRRDFLKMTGLLGLGMAGSGFNKSVDRGLEEIESTDLPGHMRSMSRIEGVEIKALCDLRPEKAEAAIKNLEGTGHKPDLYSGSRDAWKKLCDRDDMDLVIITTHKMREIARTSGHGGSDIQLCWHLIDCLHNGLPLDQDIYDAASWSSVVPLSEWSVWNRSNSIDIPDFTAGSWQSNLRNMDINLERGENTKVI